MKKISAFKRSEIIRLYQDGNSIASVAKSLGIHTDSVSRYLKKKEIPIRSNKKYVINEKFFSNILTETQAYWLGFVMADGYVAQSRKARSDRNGYSLHSRLVIRLKYADKEHLCKMVSDMNSDHPVKDLKTKDGLMGNVEIYNKAIVNDLIELGCIQGKSKVLLYPRIPQHLNSHFIRGIFDGDGTIYYSGKYKYSKFCSASKPFIEELKRVLLINGIETGKISQGKGVDILPISSTSLSTFFNYIYNNATVYLDRKHTLAFN